MVTLYMRERAHMVSVSRSFDVSKPIGQVVDYLADFAHAEEWDPGTKTCKPIGSGPLDVGSTWHNVSVFRGKETELTYRLVRREADRLVFEGTNKTATSTDDLKFTALPAGGTRITYQAHIAFHGLTKLVGWAVQGEFNRLGDLTQAQMTRVINAL
jgi:carbon monoxide dehydrogenase subunit G